MPRYTCTDGCHINYETHGVFEGPPAVVLLNGLTQTTINWRPHVLRLQKQFGVVVYDARGQGSSDLGSSSLTLTRHVTDLFGLLDHLRVRRVHLVGMSLGARLALAAAGSRPERVRRMILCSAAAAPCQPGSAMVRSWLEILKAGGLDAMAWAMAPVVFGNTFLENYSHILDKIVKALCWRNRAEALEAQLTALAGYRPNVELAEHINTPTLIISGDEDLLAPPHSARLLAERCGGRHRLLADIGHSVPAEAPELFGRTVLDFLA